MKFLVFIPDGSADRPLPAYNGLTALQAADTPNLDRLAAAGQIGLVHTIPKGFAAGSDVANMCVLGYDPHLYYTGRAPLEAASLGIDLGKNDVAFRCNLVYVEDGVMLDFSAGHISTPEAARLISDLDAALRPEGASFFPGLSYRHIMVAPDRGAEAVCQPPHDITGQLIEDNLPRGDNADWLRRLMLASTEILRDHPVNVSRIAQGKSPANMIWLWGQGKAPRMPLFSEHYGVSGSVISAVDLVKGLGKYAGLEIINVPGATGWLDTDYEAKARYALDALETSDFIYLHVEAPDEASHAGDVRAKIDAISRFDSLVVGTVLEGLGKRNDYRILVLPDHATPLEIKTHSDEPVPFVRFDASAQGNNNQQTFNEPAARESGVIFEDGWKLMDWFIKKAGT